MPIRAANVRALLSAFGVSLVVAACGLDSSGEMVTTQDATPPAHPPAETGTGAPPATSTPPAKDLGDVRAGVATVETTPAIGVPLAGYTGRRRILPDLDSSTPSMYFKPSTGVRDALHARALVIESAGKRVTFLSVDAIAMLGSLVDDIVAAASAQGSPIQKDDLVVFASHSHSTSGALTNLHFWEQAATDALVASVHDDFVKACATAIVTAEKGLAPAHVGFGWGELAGATKNRRAGISKVFTEDSVDKTMAVLRVDDVNDKPMATLVNFSIHPTALGADNFAFSADLAGGIAAYVEKATGVPMLFAQGAEGDIAPAQGGDAAIDSLGAIVGHKVVEIRDATKTRDHLRLATANAVVDFGKATLVARPDALSTPALDLSILAPLGSIELGPDFVDHKFRFQAIRIDDDVIAAIPGEPIHTLGLRIRDEGKNVGFEHVLVFGLSNGHMSYVTDADEYDAGGYEAAATLYGRDTGDRLVTAALDRLKEVLAK
ncbi:hypothetical protein AKJ09_04021 [Labilithrix luteola]|uniref:Neutral ceramidase n=1 Tax=Labilithrix luteola TaxID=1391654 RepID=A0A0K1PV07_9BACT|nr:neutral/alkaline non-lysosomal ceramidase N-terminal domain-containing protein [Labilithrix luteola]AKU97357.1 hypothetical protein AKJ09_04021 [Labilithrix luteola]